MPNILRLNKLDRLNELNELNSCYNMLSHENSPRLWRQAKFHEDSPLAQGYRQI